MARSRRVYAAPLVVVVALSPACSGIVDEEPQATGGQDVVGGGNPPYWGNTGGGPESTGGAPESTGGAPVEYPDGVGANPPAICPILMPKHGDSCVEGYGFGSDQKNCVYRCDNGEFSTVGCFAVPDGEYREGRWTSDGACGGAGGAAGGPSID